MAYTSVIPVRRLDRTVDYVQNKEKTTPKSLEEAVDYAANRDKTDSACFETGLGCTTTSAFEDMRLNTLRWHKETGVQGYHLVQSFVELLHPHPAGWQCAMWVGCFPQPSTFHIAAFLAAIPVFQ